MRFASLVALLIAAPTLASAADYMMPPPPAGRLPGPAEDFNWGGLYGGIHAGATTADFKTTGLGSTLVNDAYYNKTALPLAESMVRLGENPSDQQMHLGGFVGYNMLFDDAVVGFELDYTHLKDKLVGASVQSDSARRASSSTLADAIDYTASARSQLGDYAILKLRGGYAFGRFLPYATVGAVVAKQRLSAQYNSVYNELTLDPVTGAITGVNVGPLNRNASVVKSGYNYGGAIGVGLDWAVLDNVLLRAEYQHIAMASYKGATTSANSFRLGAGVKY